MPLLSIEPDNDDYAKDLLLDKRVNDSLEGDLDETDETLKRTECITLLCAIVTCSDGVLDSKYTDRPSAGALIAKHPGLTDMLTAAWTSKSYRDIRNLAILQVKTKMPLFSIEIDDDTYAKYLLLDQRVNDSVRHSVPGFGSG